MLFSNWQIVATGVCIALAALMLVRRVIGLFAPSTRSGCQTGGCSDCPSHKTGSAAPESRDFVSLETLVQSSHPAESSNPSHGVLNE